LPPPEAELPPGVEFYLAAFHELSHDRASGMGGPGGIPFTAIDAYARRRGIDGEDFDVLLKLLRACDAEFLAYVSELSKQKTETRR
jgi:hypothetical protein